MNHPSRALVCAALPLLLAASLTGCSNAPRTPDWQIEAKGALDRAIAAYLTGNTRVEQAEMARARLPPEEKAALLIDTANAQGGHDNISVVLVHAAMAGKKRRFMSRSSRAA